MMSETVSSDWLEKADAGLKELKTCKAELARLRALIAKAAAVVEPFAEAVADWDEMGDTRPINDDAAIIVRDLRNAAAILPELRAQLLRL